MTEKQLVDLAVEEGFAAAAIVDTTEIIYDPSFPNTILLGVNARAVNFCCHFPVITLAR